MSKNFLPLILILFIFCGCDSQRLKMTQTADQITAPKGFTRKLVKGGSFNLTTYQKITNPKDKFVIYIEGDGAVYFRNSKLSSSHPTPVSLMFLDLALLDNRPNVVYLARPCQYTPIELNPKCSISDNKENQQYWGSKRFSEEVIVSLNEAVNKITNGSRFDLVGFSGGGAVAVLIAARNKNVDSILTIAANLDVSKFAEYHDKPYRPVDKMKNSLNPIDYTEKVKDIPQLHLSGGKDIRLPEFIAKNFVSKIHTGCAKHKVIPKVEHAIGWNKHWRDILKSKITCEHEV